MRKSVLTIVLITLSCTLFSCNNYVTNIDPLNNAEEDSQLNTQEQLPFLEKGVETRFANAFGQVDVLSAALSDAFFFDGNVPNATHLAFEEIDKGNIPLDNDAIDPAYKAVGQFRFYADDLIRRTNLISITDTTIKNNALFTGYFYGGYARYLYAAYFGLNQTEGGSPINNGPFINSDQMYNLAIERFQESLKFTTDPYMISCVNSLIARAYLYKGDYTDAATYAANGLIENNAPFYALHGYNQNSGNFWFLTAGIGRTQFVADYRFKNYIDKDSIEVSRIKIDTIRGSNNEIYYFQVVYSNINSPQKIITWQENNLMRAELILRGFGSGDALFLVNEVRASHEIAPLSSVDLDVIYTERDKELFASGNRLVDERRFNKWHLDAGTWEYLPIPESERNGNPNIN